MNDIEKANAAIEAELSICQNLVSENQLWPNPLAPEAYYGLPGDIVRIIEPHSEADPVALLVNIIIAFGNIIGRTAHFCAESDSHYMNMYGVLVGDTSKGRKGSSWGHPKRIMRVIDAPWVDNRIQGGMSSGEGLIWAVRDPIERKEPKKGDQKEIEYQTVIVDHGIEDKRLMVFESEFGGVLRILSRQGSTLSPTLRQAWDYGELRVLTKNNPAIATGAHISLIGHITRQELRYLNDVEAANGFGNRIMWFRVERSKVLPEGGSLRDSDLEPAVKRLHESFLFARSVGEMHRDEEARELWARVYEKLSEGKPGLAGALTSRSEAQVMRLACVYALMDHSAVVKADHLLAALALWDYSEASVHCIFGNNLGNPIADKLLAALQEYREGLTRTELSDVLGRNVPKDAISDALSHLQSRGKAFYINESGPGRSTERWFGAPYVTK